MLSAPVSFQQVSGYVLALVGVQIYNLVRSKPEAFQGGGGLFGGLWEVAKEVPDKLSAAAKGRDKREHERASRLALQAELGGELDQGLDEELEKLAARALNIQLPEEREKAAAGGAGDALERGCGDEGQVAAVAAWGGGSGGNEPVAADPAELMAAAASNAASAVLEGLGVGKDTRGGQADVFEMGDDHDDA